VEIQDQDMSRAWIAFYMGSYQKRTQHLTTEQHGAYFLLLQHCWTHGAIPLEAASRAAIARMTPQQWKRVAPAIDPFFNADGTNNRASEEIAKAEIVSTKRAMAGQKGGFKSGIAKAIARGQQSKQVANAKQPYQQSTQQSTQQKPSLCEATHKEVITTSVSVAAREEPERLEGSLATALPEGALREPSRVSAKPEASSELKRLVASKWGVTPPAEPEAIPPFLRRTS
jgi:uncharacterized protein YdaU (DUF1376 family)